MRRNIKPLILGIFAIFLFVGIAYVLQLFLIPALPKKWQSNFTWLLGALLTTIAILSGLAQIAGIGLKDFFKSNESSQENINSSIHLVSKDQGQINWDGDILQKGSTKIVLNAKDDGSDKNKSKIKEQLISEIQRNLYDDSKLSYVLTLCIDLCNLVGLSKKYGKWLGLELVDHIDIEKFRTEFKSEEQFSSWWEKWASYRLVETYIKYGYRSAETGRYEIDTLPFKKIIIGYSVSEIINKIQDSKERQIVEISTLMRNLSEDYYSELLTSIKKLPVEFEVQRDVEIHFKVSELLKIPSGIREKVLSLLNDVRQKQIK